MRCKACDVIMTEAEDRRTFVGSGQRVELCTPCAKWVDVPMTPIKQEEEAQPDDDESQES